MSIQIIGAHDANRLFCAGSCTKLLTTFVCLSHLAEKVDLSTVLDDANFLTTRCHNNEAKRFLALMQQYTGRPFSIRDLCSYYAGLPYTFDVSSAELEKTELGSRFKHHSILDEATFLKQCQTQVTPIYTNQCKFHYSELSIIFFAYLLEKIENIKIEALYEKFVIKAFNLKHSAFSRYRIPSAYTQDLSAQYDYPSIAIVDHGYFAYSNGYFTTLNEMKILLECLLHNNIFHDMTDITHARAASHTLMNGLAVELRKVKDDIIYGYEGLSYSGCNIWAYSTKHAQGFLTFTNNEEEAYSLIYQQWDYTTFDETPNHTQTIYRHFLKCYQPTFTTLLIPNIYQGQYQRVRINETDLATVFIVGDNFVTIRDPDETTYSIIYYNGNYHIKGKDHIHGAKIALLQSKSGEHYMAHDGTLYKKITNKTA